MPRTVFAAALALTAALANCSNAPTTGAGSPSPGESSPTVVVSPSGESPSPTASASSATLAPSSSSPSAGASAAAPPGSGSTFPTPGEYVYSQSGTETLCSTTACGTPRPLPDRMYATVAHGGRVQGTDAISMEFRIAQGRTIGVDARFSSSVVTLHRFRAEFTEAGITQKESIDPSPPMTLMKFPLQAGKRWSGTFTDGDSRGEYSFRVVALETINAGGSRVRAWKIEGSIEASGDGEATVDLTTWVDPDSRTFMRVAGSIDATYDLARYKASFTDTLETAPR